MQGGEEGDQSADKHHALDSKVQDATLFGQDLAQRGVKNRGSGLHRGRKQGEQNLGGHLILLKCRR